jgi:hypothetical protein
MLSRLRRGDRIRLVSMPHDPDPIPAGTHGTVTAIHEHQDWAQVEVDWDNGRSLMLTLPDDCIAIVESCRDQPPTKGL